MVVSRKQLLVSLLGVLYICVIIIPDNGNCISVLFQPEQIHLSYGDYPSEMVVTWNTGNTTDSIVQYGIDTSFRNYSIGETTLFVDGGNERRQIYIHRVKITGLTPGQKYVYRVGSMFGWSEIFFFKAMTPGQDWSPKFLIYGDMGNVNAVSLPFLQMEAQSGKYDAVLHVGDLAYDLHTDNARVGDEFMRQIQPIAAYIPYMTCVGNHEARYNFSNYKARFSMPGDQSNMLYSFNMGPIHFIAFSTEFYYFINYGWSLMPEQYNWLINDLEEANAPENRTLRPWIITIGHRPMYCSKFHPEDCDYNVSLVRVGLPVVHIWGLEDVFYNYGVDLEFYGHEHYYERSWPVYNVRVYNGSYEEPYTNPGAPVHITSGAAGNKEEHTNFKFRTEEWSAFRSLHYGYGRLTVHNDTHLYFEQVSVRTESVIDSIWIIKDSHGPYTSTVTDQPPTAGNNIDDVEAEGL